ncbi:ybaK/ebsC protein [Beutenbergia cavernae DSM 12333]|uniref:Cys-tRNA(Pro)/Cys-tRNA(Cys) deacylase n=1 Tax=Beutenbergia cavernae (strain ATCC BAA-8 / DSM 12333 / CCUG 43141 / JCM 11478 / NBRC 16432 / NCIMB 13614 / HKI 0122) TaxID=471853 RepID=C5C2L3_BEUC1|nr:Cys-tRNA(Pro) deacylase [Beutenbergia cavernae]ACQ79699.1 ybaK/ebsC protein [Beutenbergia cavernae DSM 12333]
MSRRGAATPALAALAAAGVAHVVREYAHDPRFAGSYAAEAAQALDVPADRVLKTLVAEATPGGLVVAVLPGDATLDLKALAQALGAKRAAMADPAAAERSTGYVRGGISPLGQRTRLVTAVDASVLAHDTVLVSAGRRGLDVELAPADLVRLTAAVVAPLAR